MELTESNTLEHIVINVDQTPNLPISGLCLVDLVQQSGTNWPDGATCCTQDGDGQLIWWRCSIEKVQAARQKEPAPRGLIEMVGYGEHLYSESLVFDGQECVATDWQESVITQHDYMEKLNNDGE